MISIHAPTRGATNDRITIEFKADISIHAPTRGATNVRDAVLKIMEFQSTLLQEERLCRFIACSHNADFNPRSYKRSDYEDFRFKKER